MVRNTMQRMGWLTSLNVDLDSSKSLAFQRIELALIPMNSTAHYLLVQLYKFTLFLFYAISLFNVQSGLWESIDCWVVELDYRVCPNLQSPFLFSYICTMFLCNFIMSTFQHLCWPFLSKVRKVKAKGKKEFPTFSAHGAVIARELIITENVILTNNVVSRFMPTSRELWQRII